MREMPVKKVGEIMGETDTRLWRMLMRHVQVAYAKLGMQEVVCVGVDEMSRAKGHRYVTVFADLIKKRVLFATPGKDASTWDEFIRVLEEHNGHRHGITQVSMDMSAAYQKGVRDNCRNAQIIFDKFHVIAKVNEAVDEVRNLEVRRGDATVKKQLHKTSWIWRKNPKNLTAKEQVRLQRIDQTALVTAKAYQMRLALQEIYTLKYRSQAKRRLASWCKWVRREAAKTKWFLLGAILKVVQMIEKHLDGILAYWKFRITNAFMEGLNSVFSAVRRRARGYRSPDYLITMLYFVAADLTIPYRQFHSK
jgi:transposase